MQMRKRNMWVTDYVDTLQVHQKIRKKEKQKY
jgi:hypothetical protein